MKNQSLTLIRRILPFVVLGLLFSCTPEATYLKPIVETIEVSN